ncbi:MAG: squalene/phytoene synthase family protein [Chthoniobacterales bacterium]
MKAILKSVSRSFYLTLRFLPRPLRKPISLAYLLARATDTVADTAEIPAAIRLTRLRLLAQVIAGEEEFAKVAEPLRDLAAQQYDPAERRLMENLPEILNQFANSDPPDRDHIRAVLQTIVRGQELDLERFGDATATVSLQSAAELDEYTYLVAGCVGEFWTKLGFYHLHPFASLPPNEMTALGIEYGKGLQLINVLRDRGADQRAGRDYLPPGESFEKWLGEAEKKIDAGIDYSVALRSWRMRCATALPALIGARTIALLRAGGPQAATTQKIKVSRPDIRKILAAALLAAASPSALRLLHCRLGRQRSADERMIPTT